MTEKSILEQALLQVQNLEEAVKTNAKGILASTMKEELSELLKESKKEEKEEKVGKKQSEPKGKKTKEEEKDVTDDESDDDFDDKPSKDIDSKDEDDDSNEDDDYSTEDDDDSTENDDDSTEDDEYVPTDDNSYSTDDDTSVDYNSMAHNSDQNVMDMTKASNSEVLKVFKAMKPEDGIMVKKDDDELDLEIDGDEYIIKLDGEESGEFSESDYGQSNYMSEFTEDDDNDHNYMSEFTEEELPNENMYEIELGDEDFPTDELPTDELPTDDDEYFPNDDEDFPPLAGKNSGKEWGDEPTSDMSNGDVDEDIYEIELEDGQSSEEGKIEATEAARTKSNPHGNKGGLNRSGLPSKKKYKAGSGVFGINEEVSKLRKQNTEYKKALVLFKEKLNEVAVFNANLAYATRLFTEHSTTKQEKLNILKRFDSVSTMNESKNLFTSIKSELEHKKPVTESVVNKISSTPSTSSSEVLSESKAYENPQFKRMKDLMNKIK